MSTSLQTIPEGSPNELGPFGRSFVGEFPSRGTLSLIALGAMFSYIVAGGWLSFLLLLIIMSYLSIYMSYNYIEPHFNSKIGNVRQEKLDSIASKGHLAISDIGNMLHGYGKSAANQVWDLSGKVSLREVFEGTPRATGIGQENIGFSEKKWVSWMIILSLTIVWMLALFILSVGLFFALYIAGFSEGMAISLSGIIGYLILIPLTLLFLYIDGNLERTREMLRFGSTKRVLILCLGIPLVIMIIDFILTMIYGVVWFGIFGEPSTNTDLGTSWESSNIEIAILFLSVAVVTPIVEELMFRGYILDAISRKHSDWTAIIWSSILFGLVHIDPFVVGQAFMGGILYGWIRMRTGSLLPSIAGHMMWNMLALSWNYL